MNVEKLLKTNIKREIKGHKGSKISILEPIKTSTAAQYNKS